MAVSVTPIPALSHVFCGKEDNSQFLTYSYQLYANIRGKWDNCQLLTYSYQLYANTFNCQFIIHLFVPTGILVVVLSWLKCLLISEVHGKFYLVRF